MSSSEIWPWLPTELIYRILSELWALPLSPEDRLSALTTLPLVTKTFKDTFTSITMTNVHILCPSFAEHLLRTIRQDQFGADNHAASLLRSSCKSLSFEVQGTTMKPFHHTQSLKYADSGISNFLCEVKMFQYLPNLHEINVNYINCGSEYSFDMLRIADLPFQVSKLSVKYTFSSPTPLWLLDTLRTDYTKRADSRWFLSDISRMSIFRASQQWTADFIRACCKLESSKTGYIDDYDSLPTALYDLMIRTTQVMPTLQTKGTMTLDDVLCAGTSRRGGTTQRGPGSSVQLGVSDGFAWEKTRMFRRISAYVGRI